MLHIILRSNYFIGFSNLNIELWWAKIRENGDQQSTTTNIKLGFIYNKKISNISKLKEFYNKKNIVRMNSIFWMCVIHRSINYYIMVKIIVRSAYYTQGHIIFKILRYASIGCLRWALAMTGKKQKITLYLILML